jgi:hypothetical protein
MALPSLYPCHLSGDWQPRRPLRQDLPHRPDRNPVHVRHRAGEGDRHLHEWQTQALAAADGTNAVLEGDDATTDTVTVTVRLATSARFPTRWRALPAPSRPSTTPAAARNRIPGNAEGSRTQARHRTILLRNQTKVTGDTTTARTTASCCRGSRPTPSTTGTDPTTSGT